jgi:hypothetical protein
MVKVAEELLLVKTNIYGTMRQNKQMPIALKNDDLMLNGNFTAFRRKRKICIQ